MDSKNGAVCENTDILDLIIVLSSASFLTSKGLGSYKHHQCSLADHQRGACALRGIRRRLVLKVEGLARVSKHAEKTTTISDRGVDGRYIG